MKQLEKDPDAPVQGPMTSEMKKMLRSRTKKSLKWNELYEKKFGEHKTEMRIRLADLSSTNSWNQVVLGSFMKMFIPKQKIQKDDDDPFKFRGLDNETVKKLVNSLPSLNECIDKKHFQKLIDEINKQKILEVETHISNKVIANYEKEKEKSKVARFNYLKSKSQSKFNQIKERETRLNLESAKHKRMAENFKTAKRFKIVLKGLDNNWVQLRSDLNKDQLDRFYRPERRGLPSALELPIETTEAYRNRAIYDYFKDCPDKPKYTYDDNAEYFFRTTTGGPIKGVKE